MVCLPCLLFYRVGFVQITSFKIVAPPFKYLSILFGSVALLTWFLAVFASAAIISFIGIGGTERWVAYPIMLWLTGFGGYLMNEKS